ncbi:MAG: site-specific DNA-methyltransferase [Methylococcales bacterium]
MPTLNWIGKAAVEKHHQDVPYRLLETVPELSCGVKRSGNLIVQGDNLHALKALLPRYAGQVKCIYIDHTGNEGWVYNDNVNSPEIRKWLGAVVGKEGETLDRHDRWLCMMYPRLLLLREFLRDDGSIWISIDDNEHANLKLLMDEIFGQGKFLVSIPWESRYSRSNDAVFSLSHNHILVYASNPNIWKNILNRLPRSEEQAKQYKNPDNDPRGVWRAIPWDAPNIRENLSYPITTPTGKVRLPPSGRCWSRTEAQWLEIVDAGLAYFGKSGDGAPSFKQFLEDSSAIVPNTWWQHEDAGHTDEAKKEISTLFGKDNSFDTPKPERLIQRILHIASNPNDLILDSFLGSGTTVAVAHKMNRRYIGIEMGDHAETHCQTRLKKVVEGEQGGISKAVNWTGGSGFQFFRLSKEPLFTADGQVNTDVTFSQLAEFVWLTETKTGYTGCADSPLLGVFNERAIYLLYNGILGDKDPDKGNVLTPAIFKSLPVFQGQKIIYATAKRGGDSWLKREQIIVKQTPYALGK